jgi:sporulation protein YlmC with PRC-barrel domain
MAKDRERKHRDRAGVGPEPDRSRRRLVSMDDLDGYTFADGEPDIRGWEVCTVGGRELGDVTDLLVDPDHGEVVMLEVNMRSDGLRVEVPIRAVQLERDRRVVTVDSGDIEAGRETSREARLDDRVDATARQTIRSEPEAAPDVRHATPANDEDAVARRVDEDGTEEVVVERRPVVEEVVVRRRPVDE